MEPGHRMLLSWSGAFALTVVLGGCTLINGFGAYDDRDRTGGDSGQPSDDAGKTEEDAGPRPEDGGPADGGPTDGGPTDGGPSPSLTLSLDRGRQRIVTGTTAAVPFTIERTGFSGDVTVTVDDLPAGITASAVTVEDGTNAGELTLTDDGTSTLEIVTDTSVRATATDATASATLEVQVAGGAPGTLDTRFGTDGVLIYDPPGSVGFPTDMTAIGGGRLLITGFSNDMGFVLILGPDGTPDASFGGTGVVTPHPASSRINTVLAQADRIVYGYSTSEGGSRTASNYAAMSYAGVHQALGAIDELELPISGVPALIAATSDGFVVGASQVSRHLDNGSTVTDFGFVSILDGFWGEELAVDGADRVLTPVILTTATPRPSVIRRLGTDGEIDTTFAATTVAQVPVSGDGDGRFTDVAVRPDGSGVAVGYTRIANPGDQHSVFAAFTASGAPEPAVVALGGSLEARGMRYLRPPTERVSGATVELLPDGRALVAATSSTDQLLILIYERDGTGPATLDVSDASIARPYRLAVSDAGWFVVIDTSGGVFTMERRWY